MNAARSPERSRLPGWAVVLVALALLAVLALAVRASYPVGPSANSGTGRALLGAAVHDLLLAGLALLELAVLAGLVVFPWRRLREIGKHAEKAPRLPWPVVLRLAAIPVALLAIQALVLVWALAHGRRKVAGGGGGTATIHPVHSHGHAAVGNVSLGDATLVAVVIGVAVLLLLAGGVWLRNRRRTSLSGESPALVSDLTAGLDQGLEELAGGADPRQAVISAYARIEGSLARSGLARAVHETPLEYLQRALQKLHASAAAVSRLTALFETARFSVEAVDQAMRREAEEALGELRREIGEASAAGSGGS